MNDIIKAELERHAKVISGIDVSSIRKVADLIIASVKAGGQIIFMGNGGSSADAQHMAAEFSGKYLFDRPAMAGVSLSNIAPVTAIGNDYSYDLVFQRQIEAVCRKGDVVIGLSTSGNSRNVILAVEAAKRLGANTVSFTGDGGVLKDMTDISVIIPTKETPRIQEGYFVSLHMICGMVEREMFGKKAVLVDRDDTLVKDVVYCSDPEKLQLLPGVPKAVAKLNKAGYIVIVVTNQSGIARGLLDEKILAAIHEKMVGEIEAEGGHITDIFYCPHHPDDCCSCRKPETDLGVAAIMKYHINPSISYMIGDHDKDIEFGRRLGLKTYQISEKRTFVKIVDEILTADKR
ncbi:phosphoheptose isomerase [Candidatus Methanoplasma termitum]|uniref:GmhA1 protein n=1 Tax=Candidatus Methanoplasma termitum TaxID=1577791 RepID=A0A0A7LHM2_9ARCH|nr:HAD-IIIA family hydrolase [Candidatus Methanoplasma termitum]AIZ57011.1 phosphoheptose isomerase [Candidatus Methanoplasma termitum]MCL2334134.1 HAD-IIIA family hydrolase [Candidatus Methanoplasma sp.]